MCACWPHDSGVLITSCGTITIELTITDNYKEVNVIVITRFGHTATFYRILYLTCELNNHLEI